MAQEWQRGSAAVEPSYDQQSNPYAPIDYAARLRRPGAQEAYQPGQPYGRRVQEPPVYSAPPTAAPQFTAPSYLPKMPPYDARPDLSYPKMPPAQASPYPQSMEAGAPYPAQGFAHQPTARITSVYQTDEYGMQQPDEIAAFFAAQPEWPGEVDMPRWEDEEEPPLRDAFEPAASHAHDEEEAPEPKKVKKIRKSRIRMGRLMALVAAAGMLLFCCAAGGRLVWDLTRTERAMEEARSSYLAENGLELHQGAARVDLLPAGQTFVPTATPSPTLYAPTPSPTPVIPIHEAAVLSMAAQNGVQAAAATSAPVLRTRLTTYPNNPLCNVMDDLQTLRERNTDIVGRLMIEGLLDEIVVQRNNTYYLTHDAYGQSSEAGSIFADESCSFKLPPENLLLRGQGSVPGRAFAPLWQYVSGGPAFVTAHSTLTLTTLYEEAQYVLFAVIVADSDTASSGYFNYASHPTFATDESLLAYVNTARRHSLYQFDTTVTASDRLLTLATLGGDTSLVLLFRMVQ